MRSVGASGLVMTLVVLATACKSEGREASSYDATAVKTMVEQCKAALSSAGTSFSKSVVEHRIDSLVLSDRAELSRLLPLTIEGIFANTMMVCDSAQSIIEAEARKARSSTELDVPRQRVVDAVARIAAARVLYDNLLAAAQAPQSPSDIEAVFDRLERAVYALPN